MAQDPDWRQLKNELREKLKGQPGVEGFGVGENCLRIYVSNESLKKSLPKEFQGVSVEVVLTGEITKS